MPASASYLTKYLNAGSTNGNSNGTNSADFEESSRPKKRRKKDKSSSTNNTGTLLIADDDEGLLLSSKSKSRNEDEDEDPLVYTGNVRNVEFRKKKSSSWKTVQDDGEGAGPGKDPTDGINGEGNGQPRGNTQADEDAEQDEATKILNAVAAESAQRSAIINDEDAPTIVGDITTTTTPPDPPLSRPVMSSGAPAGLQTAADTAALLAAQKASTTTSDPHPKKKRKPKDDAEPEPETIYRDATGRRIDISLLRSEARAKASEKIAAEKQARDSAMGEVQLREREEAKERLEEARYLTIGRDADDEEMNEKLREVVRWDDPMAGYIAKKRGEERAERGGGDEDGLDGEEVGRKKTTGKKEYAGAAAPNRYGIRPGWRWDGVDRGNGFEKEWFQARGRKTRNENLEYQWAYDE